jgi:hypothetical protein
MTSQTTVLWKRAIGSLGAMTTVSTVLADMTSLTDEQWAVSAALRAEMTNLAAALKEGAQPEIPKSEYSLIVGLSS